MSLIKSAVYKEKIRKMGFCVIFIQHCASSQTQLIYTRVSLHVGVLVSVWITTGVTGTESGCGCFEEMTAVAGHEPFVRESQQNGAFGKKKSQIWLWSRAIIALI